MAELVMRLPAITTEMDEGRLLAWMVTVGQAVKEGDPICEFTTDKVDTELESPYTGTITKLLVPEGGSARVGDAIALIEGDSPNFLGDLDEALGLSAEPDGADDAMTNAVQAEATTDDEAVDVGVVPAPRAVRLEAERRGIPLGAVTPTGSRGQVTMADLDAFVAGPGDETGEAADNQVEMHTDTTVVDLPEEEPTLASGDPDEPDTTGSAQPSDPSAVTAIAAHDDADEGEPSLAAQRPQERRGRRAERTGGRRRGRRRQDAAIADHTTRPEPTTTPVLPDGSTEVAVDTAVLAEEPITLDPALTIAALDPEPTSPTPAVPAATPPVVHEVRVEHAPPFTLYAQLDVTDLQSGNESGLALLSRLVWAYGQALWEQPEANAMWDHQNQSAVTLDTVYVDLGLETVNATMETVPIAVPKDAPIAQIGLSVTNAYGLIRQGTPPEVHVPQRSATLIDLGPWRVERFTPVIQPPQVTALSVGEMQTVPSLVGRTVTIRQLVTIGLTIDTRVLDPVQAASLLATIIDHAARGDGLDQPA